MEKCNLCKRDADLCECDNESSFIARHLDGWDPDEFEKIYEDARMIEE